MKIAAVVALLCALAYGAFAYGQSKPRPGPGALAEFDAIPVKPAAQRPGRYTIAVSANGDVAWRFDTATGATGYCLVGLKPNPLSNQEGRPGSCSDWMR